MQTALHYKNEFLDLYMQMVEATESPRVYHAWSALSGVGACLGRKMWFPWGSGKLFPNIYVLLVGSPAARKSTAMEIMQDMISECTTIKFAQDDCGGKRQGLIALMAGEEDDPDIEDIGKQMESMLLSPDSIATIEVDMSTGEANRPTEDKHVIMVASTEFNNFIGHGNIEFLEFLARMYDGKRYKYQLKNKKEKLLMDEPLINLIGCTTPTNIAEAMPSAAIGQGFMSRSILVHGTKRHRELETLPEIPSHLMEEVKKRYSDIYFTMKGQFTRTKDAVDFSQYIYGRPLELNDGRFIYYASRRHTHFLKLAMIFAASRLSNEINLEDVQNSDALLLATEKTMPDALGEYGLNPISAAKQKNIDFIVHAKEPVTMNMLQQFMHRDLRLQELGQCVNDLINANKIQMVESRLLGTRAFIPKMQVSNEMLNLMENAQNSPATEMMQ